MSTGMTLTNATLKEVMTDAMVDRGTLTNTTHVDDVTQSGIYTCRGILGIPSGLGSFGQLRVSDSGSRKVQEFFPDPATGKTRPAIFRSWLDVGWRDWLRMDGTVYTS